MPVKTSSKLVEQFAKDHRQLTRKLADLLAIVRRGELQTAAEMADRLDREAGAHIQFEEDVLYPQVGKVHGRAFQEKLLSEHEVARRGLLHLRHATPEQLQDPQLRAEVVRALSTAAIHAESCGTLISHLESLPEDAQQAAQARLEQFRREGRRWTDLHGED